MDINKYERCRFLIELINREKDIQRNVKKIHEINKSKQLTAKDIDYVINRAFEGSSYILKDLENKFKQE